MEMGREHLKPLEAELLKMERSLSKLQGFDGWMIGKCHAFFALEPIENRKDKNCHNERYVARIAKCGSSASIARVEKQGDIPPLSQTQEYKGNFLQVLLVKPDVRKVKDPERRDDIQNSKNLQGDFVVEETSWHNLWPIHFSADQLEYFLKESADQNPIHRGPDAIVPGFLMMNWIATSGLLRENESEKKDEKKDERRDEKNKIEIKYGHITLEAKFFFPLRVLEEAKLEYRTERDGENHFLLCTAHGVAMELRMTRSRE